MTVVDALRLQSEVSCGNDLTRKGLDEEDIENLIIQQIDFCNVVDVYKRQACRYVAIIQVAIAQGCHLFPFRTEKLSLVTPMVLRHSGRVGSCRL